ncbi:hypothetical protein [Pseudomonas mediterranea]
MIATGTFQNVMDGYIAKLAGECAASVEDVKWSFKHYVSEPFPNLVKLPAVLIGPGEIRDIIARMIANGVTTYCNRLRSQLHTAFQVGTEEKIPEERYQRRPDRAAA